ncbi:hypothetical protein GCM10027413_27740 [Conyzicola nivalis]|uniref:Uncharacterized protein n=1 Tax=Conyzicola nivalis TaxID=1477021 RepID=A0A916WNB1_9MICO|nr:hypothetical protein [Conyzicola nivalis]GGB14808.1 hypothetical protein GCM10010979_31770 [Conyzicola nivalis]
MSETDAASDAARSNELDRLRRVAFGRTTNADEERAAASALAELARLEAEPEVAEPPVAEPVEAPPAETVTDASASSASGEPRRWLVPAAVGLLVGAIIAGAGVWALRPGEAEPATSATRETGVNYFLGDPPGETSIEGDVQAAERWFSEPQSEEDLEGVGSLLPEFDRSSVRLVHASSLAKVWVAKRVDGQLCLETTVTETDLTTGSCALPPDFADRGLTVSSEVLTAVWNGSQLKVVATREE